MRSEFGEVGRVVAANIRRLRTQQGLSALELADMLSAIGHPIGRPGISKIETLNRHVDVDDLAAVALCLGVDDPWQLARAARCAVCGDLPPKGFTCNECGSGS